MQRHRATGCVQQAIRLAHDGNVAGDNVTFDIALFGHDDGDAVALGLHQIALNLAAHTADAA